MSIWKCTCREIAPFSWRRYMDFVSLDDLENTELKRLTSRPSQAKRNNHSPSLQTLLATPCAETRPTLLIRDQCIGETIRLDCLSVPSRTSDSTSLRFPVRHTSAFPTPLFLHPRANRHVLPHNGPRRKGTLQGKMRCVLFTSIHA